MWGAVVATLVTVLMGYQYVAARNLAISKDELLAKTRAVSSTVGGAWFPVRDGLEHIVIDAAGAPKPDVVDAVVTTWDFRTAPGLYLRLRVADAKDVASVRKAALASQRDGFAGCLLHEPNTPAARGEPDAGAFAEQPWNWKRAYASTRILSDEWSEDVRASDDPLRLKVFSEQYDKAVKEEIPAAIDMLKRAQFFLFVLDEDPADVKPAEAASMTLADLEKVPHYARVQLIDLRTHTEVLRLRRAAEAGFLFAAGQPVTDPEALDAMKRQVNNCALAKEVDRAISDAKPRAR